MRDLPEGILPLPGSEFPAPLATRRNPPMAVSLLQPNNVNGGVLLLLALFIGEISGVIATMQEPVGSIFTLWSSVGHPLVQTALRLSNIRP